ncbi:hypothetical protein QP119_05040 [Corynebacterium frankenforstense]|uniref:hypothetical protein n=1 Tax=Corynebacterium TaxID=1716 RepID=UPI00254FEF8A|nr:MULTISPECIES: hypothetical protein [Corynebacterium]MDK6259789.1 hypothetical protein [Corynebacterium frankenforstense]MDK8894259.1 hypothetical protein [Corynebacterium sp. MSK006]
MSTLENQINANAAFEGPIQAERNATLAPITATPAIVLTAAKVAGYVAGAGAVTGAAYAAYRHVAN